MRCFRLQVVRARVRYPPDQQPAPLSAGRRASAPFVHSAVILRDCIGNAAAGNFHGEGRERHADYSVGTVWGRFDDQYALLDLVRGKYTYPELKRIVMQTLGKYPNAKLLIEDAGSGTSLIQDLQSEAYRYTPTDSLVTRSCG
jgi:hypothetical protein